MQNTEDPETKNKWLAATDVEINSLKQNKTRVLVK